MSLPKILVLSGSTRVGSHNTRLAALAAKELALVDADVTRISLTDYSMPIYDADLEKETGTPHNAMKLRQIVGAHQGVFIASPEYNASVTPLLKNTLDWLGNAREKGEPPLAAYQNRIFAIGAASPGPSGGAQSLIALRQILAVTTYGVPRWKAWWLGDAPRAIIKRFFKRLTGNRASVHYHARYHLNVATPHDLEHFVLQVKNAMMEMH